MEIQNSYVRGVAYDPLDRLQESDDDVSGSDSSADGKELLVVNRQI